MSSVEDVVSESIRLVRAQERLSMLLPPIKQMDEQIDEVLKICPELIPELTAVRSRMSESLGHLTAALGVLQAKVDLL